VAEWSDGWPMLYQQRVDNQRRDVTLLFVNSGTKLVLAEPALQAGVPVYGTSRAALRSWKYPTVKAPNGLLRVLLSPPEFGPVQSMREPMGDTLVLTGIATWPNNLTSNQMALVRLYWESNTALDHDLMLTVQLVNHQDDVWKQEDSKLKAADHSDLAFLLEPTWPVGEYRWRVIVDDPVTQQTVGQVDLPPFEIQRPASPPSPDSVVVTVRPDKPLQTGGWALLGTNPTAAEMRPDASLIVPLVWHKADDGVGNYQLMSTLSGAARTPSTSLHSAQDVRRAVEGGAW
jgi:hypothetical protein